MKLYTLYAPPNHRDGVVHPTRAEAEKDNRPVGFWRRIKRAESGSIGGDCGGARCLHFAVPTGHGPEYCRANK